MLIDITPPTYFCALCDRPAYIPSIHGPRRPTIDLTCDNTPSNLDDNNQQTTPNDADQKAPPNDTERQAPPNDTERQTPPNEEGESDSSESSYSW